jgi:hypothetical protein
MKDRRTKQAGRAPGRPKPARVPWATKGPFGALGDRLPYPADEGQS